MKTETRKARTEPLDLARRAAAHGSDECVRPEAFTCNGKTEERTRISTLKTPFPLQNVD